jgi:probable HAF family extracellular repeat protein
MKFKVTMVLCVGLIPMLFGIAFLADAAPKQSTGITYNATLLNLPVNSVAYGINDADQIVGFTPNGLGFIYSGGAITSTLSDGTVSTRAYGINNAGEVVGQVAAGNSTYYGFLYDGSNFTNFVAPSATSTTVALGIKSTGQIVGYGGGDVVDGVAGPYEGFSLHLGSTLEVLKVPGATNTFALGINSTDEIVGYWQNSTQTSGFIYQNGVYTVIDVPGSTNTQLFAINDLGQIVGTYTDANNNTAHPFIYESGNYDAITVLLGGQVVVGAGNTGWAVNGINKAGQIVGSLSTSNCPSCAFVADPVVKPKKH